MDILFIFWSIFSLLFLIIELVWPGFFFFLSLSIGALGGLISYILNFDFYIQWFAFVGITFLSFLVLKKWVGTYHKSSLNKTNVYALQGKQGVVVEPISRYSRGWINVQGELWAAHSDSDTSIEKGAIVEIINVKGSHVEVKKIPFD